MTSLTLHHQSRAVCSHAMSYYFFFSIFLPLALSLGSKKRKKGRIDGQMSCFVTHTHTHHTHTYTHNLSFIHKDTYTLICTRKEVKFMLGFRRTNVCFCVEKVGPVNLSASRNSKGIKLDFLRCFFSISIMSVFLLLCFLIII